MVAPHQSRFVDQPIPVDQVTVFNSSWMPTVMVSRRGG